MGENDIEKPYNVFQNISTIISGYEKDKYMLKNTDVFNLLIMLEKTIEAKKNTVVDAILGVNKIRKEVNLSTTSINSFLTEALKITTMSGYASNPDDEVNRNTLSFKYDLLDVVYLTSEDGAKTTFIGDVKVPEKNDGFFAKDYSKIRLLEVLGLKFYIKLLVILIYLHR